MLSGLAWSMDENSLREAFVKYGEVVEGNFAVSIHCKLTNQVSFFIYFSHLD